MYMTTMLIAQKRRKVNSCTKFRPIKSPRYVLLEPKPKKERDRREKGICNDVVSCEREEEGPCKREDRDKNKEKQ